MEKKDDTSERYFSLGKYQVPMQNFFMMYIERDNPHVTSVKDFLNQENYHEDLFEEETGYSKAMNEAFCYVNIRLEKKEKLTAKMICEIHTKAMFEVYGVLQPKDSKGKNGYRSLDTCSSFGFSANHPSMSVGFFTELKKIHQATYSKDDFQNNSELKMNVCVNYLGVEIGRYKGFDNEVRSWILVDFTTDSYLKKEGVIKFYTALVTYETDGYQRSSLPGLKKEDLMVLSDEKKSTSDYYYDTIINKLLEDYYHNVQDAVCSDDKIKLIGDVIYWLETLHPFADGNGRTFEFAVLNFLLIEQDLPPCSVYNAWFLSGFTSEERVLVIKEGQVFFKEYILPENCRKLSIPRQPLTGELKSIKSAAENAVQNMNSASKTRKGVAF